jgi:hypothetical protein
LILKFVAHSKRVGNIARVFGWLPGARYTNLRDVRSFDRLGFLDIDWTNYNFERHLDAAKNTRPLITVARDVERKRDLNRILEQANKLAEYADRVIIVPKDPGLMTDMNEVIPKTFILGFSVPSKYGTTSIPPSAFRRPVHLLGGRPDTQRHLAKIMPVVSLDCNRFTLDAAFGDYFDGETFRPHPVGGYERCISDSLANINAIWDDYKPKTRGHVLLVPASGINLRRKNERATQIKIGRYRNASASAR